MLFELTPRDPELHRSAHSADLIIHALGHDPDRPVITMDDGSIVTARQAQEAASRYVQLFNTLGIGPGTAVGLLSRNRAEVLDMLIALRIAGCRFTALHPMGVLNDFAYIVEDAGIEAIIFDPEGFEDVMVALSARSAGLRSLLALGPSAIGTDIIAAAADIAPMPLVAPAVTSADIIAIGYSGGTTGKPKGIAVSNQAADASNMLQLSEWEWPRDIRHLICSPLSHAGGTALIPVLVRGGMMVVAAASDPLAIMAAIERHRITSTMMVPTQIISLIDHPRFGDFDLSSLETIFYGASAFPPARLRDAIAKLGLILFQFYGQAEAMMSITLMRKAEHLIDDPDRLAACGRPTPVMRVVLLDDDNRPVPEGTPGEICVRGPLVMSGYLNKLEETAAAFAGGWLHTGDVAIRSPDGFLRIVDRKKDMIVTGGFNVFAREVEDVLMEHPDVANAAVIGVPDPKWGEAVKAYVVGTPGAVIDDAALIALVKQRKGSVQAPKSIAVIDAIPLSALGKVDKKALRTLHAAQVAEASAPML